MVEINEDNIFKNLGVKNEPQLFNLMRNSASSYYQQMVPEATFKNIDTVAKTIADTPRLRNEYGRMLVEQITLINITKENLNNDFKIFKKGRSDGTVEEIFTDIIKATKFDLYGGEDGVYRVKKPPMEALYFPQNRKDYFDITLAPNVLKSALQTRNQRMSLNQNIISVLYDSNESSEYEWSKNLLDDFDSKGLFTLVPVTNFLDSSLTSEQKKDALDDFIIKVRASVTALNVGNGTRDFNAMGVKRRSKPQNLYLFLNPLVDATVSVKELASAFNIDNVKFLSHKFIVDYFKNPDVIAYMVDEKFFQIYDNLNEMWEQSNGKNMTIKYYYHVWNIYLSSMLENAIKFTTADVSSVYYMVFTGQYVDLRVGEAMSLNPLVKAYGEYDPTDIEFTMDGNTSSSTSITQVASSGGVITPAKITLGADEQANEIVITATYTPEEGDPVEAKMYVSPVKKLPTE